MDENNGGAVDQNEVFNFSCNHKFIDSDEIYLMCGLSPKKLAPFALL